MKKSGSAEKKSRSSRRSQKLLESMSSLLLLTEPEIEAALQLVQLSFCLSNNSKLQPGEETTSSTGSCMKPKLKELQEHEEEQSDVVVGKTGGMSSPSSCSTITRSTTSVRDFGTEETAADQEDQACSSTRSIRKIKKDKFRLVFDIYNTTKPLISLQI